MASTSDHSDVGVSVGNYNKRKRSAVWDYFEKSEIEGKSKCLLCKEVVKKLAFRNNGQRQGLQSLVNQTGKFVLRSRDLGCAISDEMRVWTRKFGNVPKKRALSKSTAFIRASEKLLRNISSSKRALGI